jgi:hypothetical protein
LSAVARARVDPLLRTPAKECIQPGLNSYFGLSGQRRAA